MSEEEGSRIYTINLSKVWLAPRIRRTKRAINMIREFARRHMKSEDVKIEQSLNEMMWKRGIRHPPRRVRVKMMKDEDDVVTVSLYTEDLKKGKVKEKPAAEADVSPTPPTADETVVEGTEKEQETAPSEPKKIEAIEGKGREEEIKNEGQKKEEIESEQEKIELGEEELAEILDKETEGLEIKEEKSEKPKGEKPKGEKPKEEKPKEEKPKEEKPKEEKPKEEKPKEEKPKEEKPKEEKPKEEKPKEEKPKEEKPKGEKPKGD